MYGLIDFHVAELIAHEIGRRQMADEAQQHEHVHEPRKPSLLKRLLNKFAAPECNEVPLSTPQHVNGVVCE